MPLESASSNGFIGEEYLALYKRIERLRTGGKLQPYAVDPSRKRAESLRSFGEAAGRYQDMVLS